ncbi:MAG: hypothetical protein U1D69_05830 [Polynucleobacter sp.]|nr:hypothetical protein [Polynucleobacter sp.]
MQESRHVWQAIAASLPEGARFAGGPLEPLAGEIYPSEWHLVERNAPERIRDFRAGRIYARSALGELSVPPLPIHAHASRAPVWPRGVVGSISHCAHFCGAVVAFERDIQAIGFDVEDASSLKEELETIITTDSEIMRASLRAPYNRGETAKVLFSIKESVYKAYAPSTGSYLDFLDITLELDWAASCFQARIINRARPSLLGSRIINGVFGRTALTVFALAYRPAE